jgi:hypothetical protein
VPPVGYDDALFATGPVVFWQPQAAVVVDRAGARDAAYVGAPILSPALIGAGTALDCGGTVFARRAHADLLKPAAGTILAWLRPATVTNAWPLGADPAGANAGDFALRLRDDGAAGAYFQDGSNTQILWTGPSYYAAGQIVCMVVTFDGAGFQLYLDGHEIASSPTYTAGLTGNRAPWTLGVNTDDGGTIFAGQIDRVAIWGRVLTRNEIYLVSHLEPPR